MLSQFERSQMVYSQLSWCTRSQTWLVCDQLTRAQLVLSQLMLSQLMLSQLVCAQLV